MTEAINPAAPHHMPWFITAPGETDGLLVAMLVLLIVIVLAVGNLYFKLHALPEHMAHRTNKVQLEIVAVLALIALFTHDHLFWIAALLLALVQLPDFTTPITSIAQSLRELAKRSRLPAVEHEAVGEPATKTASPQHPPVGPASTPPALERT